MDMIELRRENLRRWVAKNGTPQKEKSLFSQLKSTGSFGEKVARRLEKQYKMGDGYLDSADAEVVVSNANDAPTASETVADAVGIALLYESLSVESKARLWAYAKDLREEDSNLKPTTVSQRLTRPLRAPQSIQK